MSPRETQGQEPVLAKTRRQVVVFSVGGGLYCLPLQAVAEVVRMVQLTPAPGTPHWVAGYLNLRGKILPVADMRLWLGATEKPTIHLNTPILIVQAQGRRAGWIVDEVSDVSELTSTQSTETEPDSSTTDSSTTDSSTEEEIATLDGRPLFLIDPHAAIEEIYQITRNAHRQFVGHANGSAL